jgi:hypothetical protein
MGLGIWTKKITLAQPHYYSAQLRLKNNGNGHKQAGAQEI